jgi:hypothetical protein
MGLSGDFFVGKMLKDMDLGEELFVSNAALLLDTDRKLYISVNVYATNKSTEDRRAIVQRVGRGLGEFNFVLNGGGIMVYREPVYNVPDIYNPLEDEDWIPIVPYGFQGDMEEYIKAFFPSRYEGYKTMLRGYEDYKDEITSPRQENLRGRCPQTWKDRQRLKILKKSKAPSLELVKIIEKLGKSSEPLTQGEIYDAFRID